jgi:hypothetical protein
VETKGVRGQSLQSDKIQVCNTTKSIFLAVTFSTKFRQEKQIFSQNAKIKDLPCILALSNVKHALHERPPLSLMEIQSNISLFLANFSSISLSPDDGK